MVSPTTEPIDPPINEKSMAATEAGCPPMVPVPLTMASFRLVLRSAAAIRSPYSFLSTKLSGSAEWRPVS